MTTLVPFSSVPLGYPGGVSPSDLLVFDDRETVISQYANSPIIGALISSLNYALDRATGLDSFYRMAWNVDTAQGYGLDLMGRIVGVSRALFVPDGDFLGFTESTTAKPFGYGIFWGGGRLTPNFNLTDIAYRRLILAKAALNITDCSIPAINSILMALFPDYGNVYVQDNEDMTMTYVFETSPSGVDYAIVTQSGALPKPVGVSFDVDAP